MKGLELITTVTSLLSQANIAIPLIVAAVLGIKAVWNRDNPGEQLTDAQVIDAMESQFRKVGADADTEIARLRAELGL